MGRMIFDLTDEDREALEAIRKQRGDRSHAETLRQLIRTSVSGVVVLRSPLKKGSSVTVTRTVEPPVPVMQRKAFNPQPKKGK